MDLAVSKEERNWGMGAHLSALLGYPIPIFGWLIGPLVVWQMKKGLPFVEDQAKEALNFQMTVVLIAFVSLLTLVLGIGYVSLAVIGIYDLVFIIIAAVKASEGGKYRYPFTLRMLK